MEIQKQLPEGMKVITTEEQIVEHMKELTNAKCGTLILLMPYFESPSGNDIRFLEPETKSYATSLFKYLITTSSYKNHSNEVLVDLTLTQLLITVEKNLYDTLRRYGSIYISQTGIIESSYNIIKNKWHSL